MKDQKFQYLDSLGGFDTHVLKVLVCCVFLLLWASFKIHLLLGLKYVDFCWFFAVNDSCFSAVLLICQARYFVDEVKDKSGDHIDVGSWKQEFVEDLPEQENGCVCFPTLLLLSKFNK